MQFAVNPEDGRLVVIEMNPQCVSIFCFGFKGYRISYSPSGSKACCWDIPLMSYKMKLLGAQHQRLLSRVLIMWLLRSLDSPLRNLIRLTRTLTTQMKSVGEVMAIGRTFQESMQKALRGLEVGVSGFDPTLGCDR